MGKENLPESLSDADSTTHLPQDLLLLLPTATLGTCDLSLGLRCTTQLNKAKGSLWVRVVMVADLPDADLKHMGTANSSTETRNHYGAHKWKMLGKVGADTRKFPSEEIYRRSPQHLE